jgi:hypothetical protein
LTCKIVFSNIDVLTLSYYLNVYAMKRIDFIKRTVVVGTLGLPLLSVIDSCDIEAIPPIPGNNPPPGSTDCLANGTNANINSNHGHTLTVSKDDVASGVEKTYAIQGSASHDHSVTLTAANFTSLKNNNSIHVDSTSGGDGHMHGVTVSCA